MRLFLPEKHHHIIDESAGYRSGTPNKQEQNLHITHWECLAVVWTSYLQHWSLNSTKCMVRTDHDDLKTILKLASATDRLETWWVRLMGCAFWSVHRADLKRQAASALSQLLIEGTDKSRIDTERPVMTVAARRRRRLKEVIDTESEQTRIQIMKAHLPNRNGFVTAQDIERYRNKIWLFIEISWSSFIFDRKLLLAR